MSTEHDYMKIEVEEWLGERPLLPRDLRSLQLVVENEEEELQLAVASGQLDSIELEAGDVLFSRKAAGLDTQQIESLINTMNLNTDEIFKKTKLKNKINYGRFFFQEVSPFDNAQDAIICLSGGDPLKYTQFLTK